MDEPDKNTIGYLTNVYPAVSHSFIKREILALEGLGFVVRRWSIRHGEINLPDETDRREVDKTEILLASRWRVLAASLRMALFRPLVLLRTFRPALAGRRAGIRPVLVRLAYLAEACCLVESARRHRVSHVHAHFGTNPAMVARLAHRLGGPKYSFTVHGPDEFDEPITLDLAGKIADAAFVAAISDYGRSQLMRWSSPTDWCRLKIVRCGIDAAFLQGELSPIEDNASATLVCVARLAPQKGLSILLEAAAQLRNDGLCFRVVVIGEGQLRPALEWQIAHAGLGNCVELRGAASMTDVRAAILSARGFVLPSFAEGLPVAIMEALALERPVITTRIAGIPELVDYTCGRIINPGDVAALAAAMKEILTAPASQLRAMGQVGRRRVLVAHDATTNARTLADLFLAGSE